MGVPRPCLLDLRLLRSPGLIGRYLPPHAEFVHTGARRLQRAARPANSTGKLWVAVGTIEDFSNTTVEDFASWLPRTRSFHETGPSSVEERSPERTCERSESAEMTETAADSGEIATLDDINQQPSMPIETYDDADAGTGCAIAAAEPWPALGLMGLLMAMGLTRRRRAQRP